jgi:NADPH-dependent curcumin reductase CurA
VQIAKKIIGAKRVIGIAGGSSKCAWVEQIGADICLDYRAADFEVQLKEATDGFVDVYLDLVGGNCKFSAPFRESERVLNFITVLNKLLSRMKRFGKIAAVGSISSQ